MSGGETHGFELQLQLVSRAADTYPELSEFRHFCVDDELWSFANEMVLEQFPDEDTPKPADRILTPISARLPAAKVTVRLGRGLFIAECQKNGEIVVLFFDGVTDILGSFKPGESPTVKDLHKKFDPNPNFFDSADICHTAVLNFAYLIALINEPRVVRTEPNGSRQQRRCAQRAGGFAVDAWHRVSWDLSKETKVKISRDPNFHKVPFHWRRGHFRRAEQHYKGAIRRADALRPEDRDVWWQWIDGHWVGHPAFGIKRSYHAPRISMGKIAKRPADTSRRSEAAA